MKFQKLKENRGITLIETIAALFILTMGIASVVGTAIFSFSAHNKTLARLNALELSREGVEVVRLVRDNSWLPPQHVAACNDLPASQPCYGAWLSNIPTECSTTGCQATFDPTTGSWSLYNTTQYKLYLQPYAFYSVFAPLDDTSSVVYRKIRTVKNTAAPFTAANPELRVISTVAWAGEGCPIPPGDDPEAANDKCKVVTEDRLTNWKSY
jgi:Tfp pilus assembly protein PilV